MDLEMRLSSDGLDDLAVASDEIMEASTAVVHTHTQQQQHEELATTTTTTVESANKTIEIDEETESSSDEAALVDDGEFQAQRLPGGDEDEIDDVDMDDYACTQVVNDEDDAVEDEEEVASADITTVAVESASQRTEDDEAVTADIVVTKTVTAADKLQPSTPKAAQSPRRVASPKKASPVKRANTAAEKQPESENANGDDDSDASPLAKFTKVLGAVWDILEQQGWQVAQGRDTLFCAMPGTQFFNFRPNINVFDSKDKACWKFIATSADMKDGDEADSAMLWEILWAVAEKKFGWYTMACGPETWFVKPDTRFEEFQPNETIFQTKKRAVLKCLELERVQVELGDSIEGHQVIDFTPKPAAVVVAAAATKRDEASAKSKETQSVSMAAPAKTPSPGLKRKDKRGTAASASPSTASSSASTAPSSFKGRSTSAAAAVSTAAKATPPKSATKTPPKSSGKKVSGRSTSKLGSASKLKKKKGPKKLSAAAAAAAAREKAAEEKANTLSFYIPEFKCTFGIVYKKLQERGWYHRPGRFEYDYFSPDYTIDSAIRNGNYFQSTAEFEEYLKDSGLWHKIEVELRDEHAETVEQLRIEARKRLQKTQERKQKLDMLKKQRQAEERAKNPPKESSSSSESDDGHKEERKQALEAKLMSEKAKEKAREAREKAREAKDKLREAKERAALEKLAATKAAKDEQRKKALAATLSFSSDFLSEFKVSIGNVVKKLVQRGWCYRPGRFEYDYFKPGVQLKDAVLNEDYFQSVAELETHLKISGVWDEIARELRDEHYAEQEREVMLLSKEEDSAKRSAAGAQQKRKSPTHATSSSLPASAAKGSPVKKARVAAESVAKGENVAASSAVLTTTTTTTSSSIVSSTSSKTAGAGGVPHIAAEEVEELTNDIWANSHHFEFERHGV